ncbi:hypothetical protein [Saccharomonospora piscinae]|uniref:hypothetical protein n=1 Tax=Saccharomonospora piscinae TaxID=687388 RepID=UPI000464997E|nr:hypothetical protein [Saccharomonospora piscinae]
MTMAPGGAVLVDGVDVGRVVAAVRNCPGVAGLTGGVAGPARPPVVSYVPGGTVEGVRVDRDRVTVQIVAEWGVPLPALGGRVREAVVPHVRGRRVDVAVADLVAPEER